MTTLCTMNYSSFCSDDGDCEGSLPRSTSIPTTVDTRETSSDSYLNMTSSVEDGTPAVPVSPNQSSPTRGVKKVPSLRRGAAGFAQLLQSAVMASIEVHQDGRAGLQEDRIISGTISREDPSWNRSLLDQDDRRGQKNKRIVEDVPPMMPRRTHCRREDSNSSGNEHSVLSHHNFDNLEDSDSHDMDLC